MAPEVVVELHRVIGKIHGEIAELKKQLKTARDEAIEEAASQIQIDHLDQPLYACGHGWREKIRALKSTEGK